MAIPCVDHTTLSLLTSSQLYKSSSVSTHGSWKASTVRMQGYPTSFPRAEGGLALLHLTQTPTNSISRLDSYANSSLLSLRLAALWNYAAQESHLFFTRNYSYLSPIACDEVVLSSRSKHLIYVLHTASSMAILLNCSGR